MFTERLFSLESIRPVLGDTGLGGLETYGVPIAWLPWLARLEGAVSLQRAYMEGEVHLPPLFIFPSLQFAYFATKIETTATFRPVFYRP